MLLVTGGAGFIGSNVVAALNEAGRSDVVVCDFLGNEGKWRNLAKRRLADIVPPVELGDWLEGRRLDAIIRPAAIRTQAPRNATNVLPQKPAMPQSKPYTRSSSSNRLATVEPSSTKNGRFVSGNP